MARRSNRYNQPLVFNPNYNAGYYGPVVPPSSYMEGSFVYNDNNRANNRANNRVVRKRSGAKFVQGMTKDGHPYRGVVAWFWRKSCGMVKISAFENQKSTEFETSNGRQGIALLFEVLYRDSGVKHLETGTYFYDTGKVFLKRLGIVISTKAPNGGYCGFFSNSK